MISLYIPVYRYDVVNINLKSKPEWFLERNPLGKVPTIEEPGKKPLFESLIVAEYLDEQYPGTRKVLPTDAYEKARQKVLIEVLSQKVFIKRLFPVNFLPRFTLIRIR